MRADAGCENWSIEDYSKRLKKVVIARIFSDEAISGDYFAPLVMTLLVSIYLI